MKKFAAVFTALVMIFVCAGCAQITISVPENYIPAFLFGGGNSAAPAEQNTAAAPVTETPSAAPSENADTPASEAPATEAPAKDASAPTEPASQSSAPTEAASQAPASSGAPSTKEEVIAYYVAAYNKIDKDAKSIVRNYDNTSQYNNILNVNGNSKLESLANKLMGMFMGPTEEDIEYSINDLPPKNNASITITPAQVATATCVDQGATYLITMTSTGTDDNYELDAQPGQNSAGVIGPLLRTEDVTDAAGSFLSFEGLHAKYATCTVKATVDKASGHITNFDFNSPCILHFDQVNALKIVKVQNCDIGLLFEQRWTINY